MDNGNKVKRKVRYYPNLAVDMYFIAVVIGEEDGKFEIIYRHPEGCRYKKVLAKHLKDRE